MKKLIWLVAVMATLALPSRIVLAQTTDPLAIVQANFAALNRGDVEAALAMFADDATLSSATGSATGKEQIRRKVQADVAIHVQLNASNLRVTGDQVTYTFSVSNDQFRSLGIDAVEGEGTVTIRGGKITQLSSTPSAASRARIQQAMAAAPRTMPSTGAADVSLAVLLLALGGLAVLAGAGVRVRRRV